MADIPGLIEGAHEGAGLGTRFLGHVERCGVLLHLVDGTEDDVVGAYRTVRAELEAYGHGLADKTEVVALNKIDALDKDAIKKKRAALKRAAGRGKTVLAISAVAGSGVQDALRAHPRPGRRRSARRSSPSRSGLRAMSAESGAAALDQAAGAARLPTPSASSSRSARRCWSTRPAASSGATGSTRWPTTSRCCRARGQEVILVSSGAIAVGRRHLGLPPGALRLEEKQAAAATGQIRLAHAYQESARAPRHHRRADPADARRHRGAPPPSQRARRRSRRLLAARRRAGHQRERHGRDRRDPLRRQRPAGRARRADDQRRHAGAAVRHRRPLHRRSQARPERAAHRPGDPRDHAARSRRWPARRRPATARAAW